MKIDNIVIKQIRSQGAGGQNVNKVASAVQLVFDIKTSSLSEELKYRLLTCSDNRITKDGLIVIKAQNHRTFEKNKKEAFKRLNELIDKISFKQKKRKGSTVSKCDNEKRLDIKKKKSIIKSNRKKVLD